MLASSVPPKFPIPFGNSASGSYKRSIPAASQIGILTGAASLTDGFPPVCFSPVGGGGTPPSGLDFNGILFQISQWSQWQGAGAPVVYDGTFQAAVGGYPQGAVIQSAATVGLFFLSTVDSNTSNPDAGGANWVGFYVGGANSNRVITASGAFTTLATDLGGSIGLYRTSGLAASSTTLPSAVKGQRIRYYDLSRNFNAYPLTVNAPGGASINGSSNFVANINTQAPEFEYFGSVGGSPMWGVKS